MTIQNLRGTRDFYPEDMAKRQALYDVFDTVLQKFGYQYYDAPILESFDLYASKSSAEIVEQQSYVFEDRGGRKLVVRPEMTPSVARMVAAKQGDLPRFLRWYTVADCWRYERPQKGRLRNFFQLNVDMFGSDTAQADAEVISTGFEILRELAIPNGAVKARLNDRTILDSIFEKHSLDKTKSGEALSILDRKAKMEADEFKGALLAVTGDALADELIVFMNLETSTLPETPEYDRLRSVMSLLGEMGYGDEVVFDPSIVRGFDYYTGLVFEFFDDSGQFGRSIFGGGRYDKLIENMGGRSMPAIGYAVSAVTIEELFTSLQMEVPENEYQPIFIAPFSENEEAVGREIAETLREGARAVILGLPPYDMGKQLKFADQIGAKNVILVSPDELKEGKVVLKNMETGDQQEVSLGEIVNTV